MGPLTWVGGRWITQVQHFNEKQKKAGNGNATEFSLGKGNIQGRGRG